MTTDTAAALRATEIDADVLLMAKYNVDGVYASDPNINPEAKKLDFLTYRDVFEKQLAVMDITAVSLCMENNVPIIVFDMFEPSAIKRILVGERIGSLIAATQTS